MSALNDSLTPGEVVLYRTRCHPAGNNMFWFIAILLAIFFYSVHMIESDPDAKGLTIIAAALLLIIFVCVGIHLVGWRGTETAITNLRVVRVTGKWQFDDTIVDGTAATVPLRDVRSVHVEQNDLLGGLLGYGSVVIEAPAEYGCHEPAAIVRKKILGKTVEVKSPGKYGPLPTDARRTRILGKTFVDRKSPKYSPEPTGRCVEIVLGKIPHPERFCDLVQEYVGGRPSGASAGA